MCVCVCVSWVFVKRWLILWPLSCEEEVYGFLRKVKIHAQSLGGTQNQEVLCGYSLQSNTLVYCSEVVMAAVDYGGVATVIAATHSCLQPVFNTTVTM